MARGLTEFTVQQATNFEAFSDWNFQAIDVSGDSLDEDATYITSINPAKKVILYDRGAELNNSDDISITLNGNSATGKVIIVNGNNLPFTISGLAITSLNITIPDADTDSSELLGLLSFH